VVHYPLSMAVTRAPLPGLRQPARRRLRPSYSACGRFSIVALVSDALVHARHRRRVPAFAHAPAVLTAPVGGPRKPVGPQATVALPASTAYVLVDVNTGNVLAADNEHLRLPPASLTKVLTALIAVNYLRAGAGVLAPQSR